MDALGVGINGPGSQTRFKLWPPTAQQLMLCLYGAGKGAGAVQTAYSVLDRIVPGYYQRYNAAGALETSTCCANTAI